jgi:hypothetical protein
VQRVADEKLLSAMNLEMFAAPGACGNAEECGVARAGGVDSSIFLLFPPEGCRKMES